jgi:hypothetical protein
MQIVNSLVIFPKSPKELVQAVKGFCAKALLKVNERVSVILL